MSTTSPDSEPLSVTVTLPPRHTADSAHTLVVPVLQSEVLRAMATFIDVKRALLNLPLSVPGESGSRWRAACWEALRMWSLYCNYLRMHHGVGTDGRSRVHRLLSDWRNGVMADIRLAVWMYDRGQLNPSRVKWPVAPAMEAALRDEMEADEDDTVSHCKLYARDYIDLFPAPPF